MALSESLAFLGRFTRFINYELRPDPHRPEKLKKIPISPITGYQCDPTDTSHHVTYERAFNTGRPVGFVFMAGDGTWFADFDSCLQEDGTWSAIAQYAVDLFGGHAACEVSQSRTGLHLFGWASTIPEHACRNIPLGLELYHENRFVALTDLNPSGAIDADTAAPLATFADQFFRKSQGAGDIVDWTDGPVDGAGIEENDDQLIRIMLKSGQKTAAAFFGGAGHVAFTDLWHADAEKLGTKWPSDRGEPYDASQADSALASHLAYWTAKDCERIERLMRKSALARDKWERPDYLPRTILGACRTVRNVARPREVQAPLIGIPVANMAFGPTQYGVNPISEANGVTVDPTITNGGAVLQVRGVSFMSAKEQKGFFEGCVYVNDINRIWVPGDGSLLDKPRFDIIYGGSDFDVRPEGKVEKSAWEAYTRNQFYAPSVARGTCFRPELPPGTITHEGYVNTYLPMATPEQPGDVSKFLLHLEKLFPDANDRAIIIAYMAATVRSPGAKHQWAPVIQGCEGNGKTILNVAMSYSVGANYTHIARAAALAKTGLQFNKWTTGKLYVCFEEINVSESRNFLDEIKDIITNRRVAMEGKGADQTTADNRANFMFFTNYRDAVPIKRGNRRYAIFYCPQQDEDDLPASGMDGNYFSDLWDWLEGRGNYAGLGAEAGLKIINHWLKHIAVVDARYDPRGECQRAPKTSSTEAARSESLGSLEQEVLEQIQSEAPGFAGGWVCSYNLGLLLDRQRLGRMSYTKRREMLKGLGYIPHPGLPDARCQRPLEGGGGKPRLFIREGHISLQLPSPGAVQAAYESAQAEAVKRNQAPVKGLGNVVQMTPRA